MSEPVIKADESLVRNGYFLEAFNGWKKGPISQDYLGPESEFYQDERITFMAAGNQSSISQEITLPIDASGSARYILSFLCETRHTKAGLMRISINGSEAKQEISLEPGKQRNQEEDQARLTRGQPLVYAPIEYEVELQLGLKSQDVITIGVFSPKNEPSDVSSKICFTRIRLALHLGPVEVRTLLLDDMPVPKGKPLYLCVDAAHKVKFELAQNNEWWGTEAALISENNPDDAILATPDWRVNQPVERAWLISCPRMEVDVPIPLSLILRNQYTADPYQVSGSLGHHRLAFLEVVESAYHPVLEYDQSVRLGVQVISHYTSLPLSGRPVTWTLGGQQVMEVIPTNDEGWAYFEFQPTQAGDIEIQASVESLYFPTGVVTHRFAVRVLATDPWKDISAVVEGVATRWEEKTGYPNRGAVYPVIVKLPADSPLQGAEIALHWSGDAHEQLGVVVSPALEHPVPATGVELNWTLTSDDLLDGRFELALVCSSLLLPSPKKRMSLARNVVNVGEVREADKFPVIDENESVLLRVQVVHVIASGTGDPVNNALVEWKTPEGTISTRSGAGGWASVRYMPESAGDKIVMASIKAHPEAVATERPFNVKAIASSPWKSEVKIFLDGEEVDRGALGVLCRRGQTHTLKVVPVAGSPWIGKNVSLQWRGVAPAIGLVLSDPGTPKPLLATGVEWTLASAVAFSISSLFELELHIEGVAIARELSGRLVSVDLTEELRLMLDQISAVLDGQTLYPCLGALHDFNVVPNALSPLVGLKASLTWSGTPADQLGAIITPALDQPQSLDDGGARWVFDFKASQHSGEFGVALTVPQLNFVAVVKPMKLAHNKVRIAASRESAVDPVIGQEPARLWVQVFSHFTGKAVGGVPVNWVDSSVVLTDEKGWSGFSFPPADAHQEHQVKAVVQSPYDGYQEQRVMTVRALPRDPWAELMVSFDGLELKPWGQKTYFPRRKGEHSIALEAPANSELLGRDLTLGMTGTGPAALAIKFSSSGLGVPRRFESTGLKYLFNVGDLKDGSFALRLSSERLASLSPANAMSVGEGSQVLKISGSSVYQTLDWGQKFCWQVTVMSVISGRPMVGQTVTWRSPDLGVLTSVTNYYGVASICFVPTIPGKTELTATVGLELNSDSVSVAFTLNEPRKISEFFVPVRTQSFDSFAQVKIVSSRNGMPLKDVEVMWEYWDKPLPSSFTNVDGIAQLNFLSVDADGRGLLSATVKGGELGWETATLKYSGLVPVIHYLTSSELTIAWGKEASAEIRVISRWDGLPREGIQVRWEFPELSLPATITDMEGKSRITFTPAQAGLQKLAATVGLGDTKSLDVEVLPPLRMMTDIEGGGQYPIDGTAVIEFRILSLTDGQPIVGKEVHWQKSSAPDGTSMSNQEGRVHKTYFSEGMVGYKVIRAFILNEYGTVQDQESFRLQFDDPELP
ncbi:Ig-like domain-containing protein [Pseudomonas sp.]|uniref:Ig-like domain-containing protein n=1 Tax=Pseudomonas sp. TaxID=306 RepID=UPI003F344AD6